MSAKKQLAIAAITVERDATRGEVNPEDFVRFSVENLSDDQENLVVEIRVERRGRTTEDVVDAALVELYRRASQLAVVATS